MKACELCGKEGGGVRHAKHTACFSCIDKMLEFAVTAGMRFDNE